MTRKLVFKLTTKEELSKAELESIQVKKLTKKHNLSKDNVVVDIFHHTSESEQESTTKEVMRLYRWQSEFMSSYSMGEIIVMATSVKEARSKVSKYFIDNQDKFWNWETNAHEFYDDISNEPEISLSDCAFISSSN